MKKKNPYLNSFKVIYSVGSEKHHNGGNCFRVYTYIESKSFNEKCG